MGELKKKIDLFKVFTKRNNQIDAISPLFTTLGPNGWLSREVMGRGDEREVTGRWGLAQWESIKQSKKAFSVTECSTQERVTDKNVWKADGECLVSTFVSPNKALHLPHPVNVNSYSFFLSNSYLRLEVPSADQDIYVGKNSPFCLSQGAKSPCEALTSRFPLSRSRTVLSM